MLQTFELLNACMGRVWIKAIHHSSYLALNLRKKRLIEPQVGRKGIVKSTYKVPIIIILQTAYYEWMMWLSTETM